jgi:MFS family permease
MSRSVFALLCASVWINYIDRGNLSVAAPVLQPEMGLSPAQLGVLLSAFFWTYSLMQPVAGWLVDRFDVYRVYAVGFAVWSVAVAAGGLTHSFWALLATRLALGVGESVAYPSYSRILTSAVPEGKRGFANAMIDTGTKAGPALGTFAGGLLVQSIGWRQFFFALGAISLLWIVPWMRAIPKAGARHERTAAPPASAVLRRPEAWVTFGGLFCFNYAFYFLLTWLPTYLVRERQFSMRAMAIYGALPFCATAASSILAGRWADGQIRLGGAAARVRRRVAVMGLLLSGVMLMSAALAPASLAMVCLVIAFIGIGLFTGNAWAITQTLAGPQLAGSWTGWQNAVGNLGGVLAPIVTGWSVGVAGTFVAAFAVASSMLLVSAMLYGWGLSRAANFGRSRLLAGAGGAA